MATASCFFLYFIFYFLLLIKPQCTAFAGKRSWPTGLPSRKLTCDERLRVRDLQVESSRLSSLDHCRSTMSWTTTH